MEGNQYYVKPADFSGGLNAAMSGFQSYADDTAKQNEKTKSENIQAAIAQAVASGDVAKIREVSERYPTEVGRFQTADAARIGIVKQTRAETARKIMMGELPLEQGLDQHAEQLLNSGVDAGETLKLAQLARLDPEKAMKAVQTMYALNATPEEWKNYSDMAGIGGTPKQATDLSQFVEWEIQRWLSLPENAGKTIADVPPEVKQNAFLKAKRVQADEAAGVSGAKTTAELTAKEKLQPKISGDIKKAETDVETAAKKQQLLNEYEIKLQNEPTLANLKKASELRAELAYIGLIEQAKSEGAAITAETTKNLEKISNTAGSVSILKDAISQIDNGADTGKITNLFPSFRASTIQLNNLKNQLGLSVIQSATFGALAKSEMDFALDTAMPTGLQPTELRAWLVRKESAQQKALDGFKKYTIELNKPGMTRAKILQSGLSTATPSSGEMKTITSQQEYQSLPAGTEYMYNGQKFKKGQ